MSDGDDVAEYLGDLQAAETLNALAFHIHSWAVEKGWAKLMQAPDILSADEVAAKIALMHSELSEALEIVRAHGPDAEMYRNVPVIQDKPEGLATEFADTIIRILQLCGQLDLPVGEALVMKLAYNEGRPFKHGKKI